MANEDFSQTQIRMLERRWRQDPSPHLSLQLADLYRQKRDLSEAIPVLEKGLAAHPGHLSVQVALGRYRLEAGNAEGAAEVLGDVVRRDAGHLVANKLLVKAYLALGDLQKARDRLDLYTVLNDSDPELAKLRSEVGGTAPFESGEPAAATDLGSIAPPGERSLTGALDREPFAALLAKPFEPADLEPIFHLVEQVRSAPATEEPAPPPTPIERSEEERSELGYETERPLVVEEGEETEAEDAFATRHFDLEPADEPATEPPETAAPPREVDAGSGATATLGALYLAQGHLDEAEETFERVLARDPEDAEARAGLEEVERRRAGAPVEPVAEPEEPAPVGGRDRARIEALRRYLGRIRRAADRLSA